MLASYVNIKIYTPMVRYSYTPRDAAAGSILPILHTCTSFPIYKICIKTGARVFECGLIR